MFAESLQQALDRWKSAFGQYDELKTASEPAVVRWEWADGERYSLLPFYFKRYPGRARRLKTAPVSRGYFFKYGFDEQNRPRMHRCYNYLDLQGRQRLERDRLANFAIGDLGETYYTYGVRLAEVIEFSVPPRIPLKVQQITYDGGRVIRHTSFRLNGYTPLYSQKGRDPDALYEWLGPYGRFKQVEQYAYKGDRLVGIHFYSEQPGTAPFEGEERFSYNDAGKLTRIERFLASGGRQLLYRKREPGQTFKSMREAATQCMVAAVVERLRSENIDAQLCCIELSYLSGAHHFPPVIVPSYEDDRRRLLESGDPGARYHVFAPARMGPRRPLEITDPATLEICSQLEQEIQAGMKWDTATSILRDVAAALTRYDWRGIFDVTPDFVVFAMDWELEGDQLAAALSTSASPEQLQDWKAKGWY